MNTCLNLRVVKFINGSITSSTRGAKKCYQSVRCETGTVAIYSLCNANNKIPKPCLFSRKGWRWISLNVVLRNQNLIYAYIYLFYYQHTLIQIKIFTYYINSRLLSYGLKLLASRLSLKIFFEVCFKQWKPCSLLLPKDKNNKIIT